MKRIIILMLIFFNISIYSQTEAWILKQKMDWNDYPEQISNTKKKHIIDSLVVNSDFSELSKESFKYSSFHFVDINMDSQPDIIYFGFAGSESDRTIIYVNKKGKYIQIADYFGYVFNLQFTNGLLNNLFIGNYSCCAGYITHYEKYKFYVDNSSFILKEKIATCEGTSFPAFKTMSKRFTTVKNKYRLRSEPIIDNTEYGINYRPFEALGNILGEFKKNSEGIAIAESMDTTGRVWWFVIMKDSNQPDNSIFYRGSNNQLPYKFAGWMSSRYLNEK